jgi:hypothetical protein
MLSSKEIVKTLAIEAVIAAEKQAKIEKKKYLKRVNCAIKKEINSLIATIGIDCYQFIVDKNSLLITTKEDVIDGRIVQIPVQMSIFKSFEHYNPDSTAEMIWDYDFKTCEMKISYKPSSTAYPQTITSFIVGSRQVFLTEIGQLLTNEKTSYLFE